MTQPFPESGSSVTSPDHELGATLTKDPSLSRLMMSHGLSIREFVLVGVLSERGPTPLKVIANVLQIEPQSLSKSARRLADAGLVMRGTVNAVDEYDADIRLTSRGQEISNRLGHGL